MSEGWDARLELGFAQIGERTTLVHRLHSGPLSVQRAFYPERDGTAHAYVLHPPGGVVGGDRLTLDVRAGDATRVLITTPAANKLYRSNAPTARITQRIRVGPSARMEWLPQETIVYDGAQVVIDTRFELERDASLIAWDVTCLGRPAIGERLTRGCLEQRLSVTRAGEPLVLERTRYAGSDAALSAAFGLHGQPVTGTLLCIGGARPDGLVSELRDALSRAADTETACTTLAHALVCRYRGGSVERAQLAFRAAWEVLRKLSFASEPVAPRIWST